MDQKKLYGRWTPGEELIGYPMMIYYWIKGEKVQKLLAKRIEKAKQKSAKMILSEKMKNEFLIKYKKLDNFSVFISKILIHLEITILKRRSNTV